VDSDDEWERNEPEDGEDCSSDEDMDEEMDHDEMAVPCACCSVNSIGSGATMHVYASCSHRCTLSK
jgi:hypothetical protein